MPSKPEAEPAPIPAASILHRFQVVSAEGADAGDFLQRQSMNDVRDLKAAGDWHWNGLLSAKGRVLSLFALLRTGEHGFWLILPDGDAAHWADALGRLKFRSKLEIRPCPELICSGLIAVEPPVLIESPSRAVMVDDVWYLDLGSPERPRTLTVGSRLTEPLQRLLEQFPDADAGWTLEDLRHGLPRIPATRRDTHTPQMLGLDRLAAFSVKKGCYPGQEIVARTHFLGQAKRRLQRLVPSQPLATDATVRCGDQSCALFDQRCSGDACEALAVLPIEPADAPCVAADGTPLRRKPFIDGLARRSR